MPSLDTELHVYPAPPSCPHCGHPRLASASHPRGRDRLVLSYCPACLRVRAHATVPDWFWAGLPLGPGPRQLH